MLNEVRKDNINSTQGKEAQDKKEQVIEGTI
jgi:hypothetical protein